MTFIIKNIWLGLLIAVIFPFYATEAQRIDSLKSLIASSTEDTAVTEFYRQISSIYENRNLDSSRFYADKSFWLADSIGFLRGKALAKEQQAWVASYEGNSKRAIELITEGKALAEELEDKFVIADVLNSIGELYNRQNSTEQALRYFREALKLQKEIGYEVTQVYTLSNLSILFGKSGDLDNSRDHILEAYQLADKLKDDKLITLTSNNLARVYLYRKEYEASRQYAQIGAKYAEKMGNLRTQAFAINNIGMTYEYEGNTSQALAYYKKSLAICTLLKDQVQIISTLMTIGDFFKKLREYDSAEHYYKEGLDHANMEDHLNLRSRLHSALYTIDTTRHNYESALHHINQYILIKDSISARENKKVIEDLKMVYNTERKDDKIVLLKQQNEIESIKSARQKNLSTTFIIGSILLALLCLVLYSRYIIKKRSFEIITTQKDEIEEKNEENILLIKETHHRVKNNLQLVLSLLSTQRHIFAEDEKVMEIIQESKNRIKSISLLHENLYDNKNLSTVNTKDYFKDIIANIKNSFIKDTRHIGIETEIEEATIDTSLAVTLGLIINELVTNSLKYAFNDLDSGFLKVLFKKSPDDNSLYLEISDNGRGLPKGFDMETSESFGLQMVQGLVHQLNGMIVLKTDNGTEFDISINSMELG